MHKADFASAPFALDRTQSISVRSRRTGDTYRLFLALPEGPPPPTGWPVLYLLDATGSFATCVEALRRMARRPDATGVSPMVIAGLSADTGYDVGRRQRDYTSVRPEAPVQGEHGMAGAFLDFIEEEIKPMVARQVAVDPSRQALCGHSLAGYFVLWALVHRPHAFRGYAAISPSVWWDKAALIEAADRLGEDAARAFITIGEWEDELPPWQQAAPGSEQVLARRKVRGMVVGAREVAARLQASLGSSHVHFSVLPGEDHASIISTAMPRVLRFISLPPG
jgi:predicted alpha/beta superfamily hydrolase